MFNDLLSDGRASLGKLPLSDVDPHGPCDSPIAETFVFRKIPVFR